jgi:hypothetical protein
MHGAYHVISARRGYFDFVEEKTSLVGYESLNFAAFFSPLAFDPYKSCRSTNDRDERNFAAGRSLDRWDSR